MKNQALLFLSFSFLLFGASASAQICGDIPDVMILLDRSGSMNEYTSGITKWSSAKDAIKTILNQFDGQAGFGMMLFPRWPHVDHCTTGQVNVAPSTSSSSSIRALLNSSYPKGDTPSTKSLLEANSYFLSHTNSHPDYVILITDGLETCSPNWPNTATSQLLANGVKTFVIGFGSEADAKSLQDAAQAGGTGQYYLANDLNDLTNTLKQIMGTISCCGNGALDTGEICDTAIAAGQPGACPTTCNDGNPCTTDTILGGGCNSYCGNQQITTPINNDGCCPPGATSANDNDCTGTTTCGNGKLDSGEICDIAIPAGQTNACPTNCDDGNACTQDIIVGTGCQSYCQHTNICGTDLCGNGKLDAGETCDTAISKGSQYACPESSTDCSDNDPSTQDYVSGTGCQATCQHGTVAPVCGNGKVDPGEWCDTAILPGQTGSCPLSCNDNIACTSDILTGSGCMAFCANPPITTAINGDGCCPPGTSAQTDSDCGSACGNGLLEQGELCDPKIPQGQPGACITECPKNVDPCTTSQLVGSGCDVQCVYASIEANLTISDGCCPKGLTNAEDIDCLPPCGPDRTTDCVDPCEFVDCEDGYYCVLGECKPWPGSSTNPEDIPASTVAGGCDCQLNSDTPTAQNLVIFLLLSVFLFRRRRS